MNATDDLTRTLKKLRLSGVLDTLELRRKQAVDDDLPFEEFLLRLLCDELERREAKQLRLRLQRAQFEYAQTLEDFDFTFNPKVPKTTIIDLATGLFIDRHENLVLAGPSGVGKSHIAQALGNRACRQGKTVLFAQAHQLFAELRAARADLSYDRRMLRYASVDLLIIDDLGLRPLQYDEPVDLHELIRQRYRKGSMIITSNRAVSEWYPMFGDALLASAAMDRLLHDAHVVEMDGDSYRNPPARKKKAA